MVEAPSAATALELAWLNEEVETHATSEASEKDRSSSEEPTEAAAKSQKSQGADGADPKPPGLTRMDTAERTAARSAREGEHFQPSMPSFPLESVDVDTTGVDHGRAVFTVAISLESVVSEEAATDCPKGLGAVDAHAKVDAPDVALALEETPKFGSDLKPRPSSSLRASRCRARDDKERSSRSGSRPRVDNGNAKVSQTRRSMELELSLLEPPTVALPNVPRQASPCPMVWTVNEVVEWVKQVKEGHCAQ